MKSKTHDITFISSLLIRLIMLEMNFIVIIMWYFQLPSRKQTKKSKLREKTSFFRFILCHCIAKKKVFSILYLKLSWAA